MTFDLTARVVLWSMFLGGLLEIRWCHFQCWDVMSVCADVCFSVCCDHVYFRPCYAQPSSCTTSSHLPTRTHDLQVSRLKCQELVFWVTSAVPLVAVVDELTLESDLATAAKSTSTSTRINRISELTTLTTWTTWTTRTDPPSIVKLPWTLRLLTTTQHSNYSTFQKRSLWYWLLWSLLLH